MTRARVAIVGAGIGGLAAAAALVRAGCAVEVYEQAPALREVGVGLHLGPNGSRLLYRWGLGDRIRAVASTPEAMEVRHAGDGRVLVRQPMGDEWTEKFGAPYHTVHRVDLHRILAAEVPSENVHLGRELVDFAEDADGVSLRFADGTTATADVLVGADGVHSRIRRAVAGPDVPVFSGTSAFRGVLESSRLSGASGEVMSMWVGGRARLLCYPVRGGDLTTFVVIVPDESWDRESWSAAGDPADLAAALDGWPPAVSAITEVREVRRWALYDREPLESWGGGRVTLLGDAAHPMLPHHGQGASQAIEDAVALARCVGDAAADGFTGTAAASALGRYEAVRRPHTTLVQTGSRGSGTLKLTGEGPKRDGGALSSMVDDVAWLHHYDVEVALAETPDGSGASAPLR
ncbi:FAD-dependent monooxygenase [Amycolatopsis sp. CA-230715]|uniref:FAD-dependent monooxygenase n=1 Tax=Amycolatopsis sp. CA-230715 TaxID=2745196 RepID=UPI001C021719|nr:FAD-dependent monooxygenase [Amycolatopsis sp. CA-230715]